MEKDWSQMLPELLGSISDRLPLVDYINFRGVCHCWRSNSPPGRSEITNFSKKGVWLLFYDIHNGDGSTCYLYSDSHLKPCAFRLPHLCGASIIQSKFGWLLAHTNGQLFLHNPFTFEKIDLPKHAITDDQVCSFMFEPTHPCCTVFIVSRWKDSALEVSSCRLIDHDDKWNTRSVEVNKTRMDTMVAALLCCGCEIGNTCSCGHRNKIHIFDSEKYLVYDYTRNLVESEGNRDSGNTPSTRIFEKVEDAHRDDWLHRFGEKGFLVSTCAFSTGYPPVDGRYSRIAWHEYVNVDDGDEEEEPDKLNMVKAAWIEPMFGNKKKN